MQQSFKTNDHLSRKLVIPDGYYTPKIIVFSKLHRAAEQSPKES